MTGLLGGLPQAFAKLFSLLDGLSQSQRDNELRKDGARQADIAQREAMDDVRREAEDYRDRDKPTDPDDVLDRL